MRMKCLALLLRIFCPDVIIMTVSGDVRIEEVPRLDCRMLDGDSTDLAMSFIAQGRPVVLEHAATTWTAMNKWSMQYFREIFGDQVQNRQIKEGEAIFGDRGEFLGLFNSSASSSEGGGAAYEGGGGVRETSLPLTSWLVDDPETSRILRHDYTIPACLSFGGLNHIESGPEYFFIASEHGAGRAPHIDYRLLIDYSLICGV